jgi:hypothetical protein
MTSMENRTNSNDPTIDDAGMLEEGYPGEGMRQRPVNPAALTPNGRAKSTMSLTSKMYDVDGDGKLDAVEKSMRDMDTDNRGYLTNEKVYKIMLEQMKLQKEVFGLKRMSLVFLAIVFILSLATLGTSFAAAILAKDTELENGNLVSKDGGGVVGTSNVATTFTVKEGTVRVEEGGAGRRTQGTAVNDQNGNLNYTTYAHDVSDGTFTTSNNDAGLIYTKCYGGGTVFLKKEYTVAGDTAGVHTVTVHLPLCSNTQSTQQSSNPDVYTFMDMVSEKITTISCPADTTLDCEVIFPTIAEVPLGDAGDYAILSKTGISTVPDSTITGDIAVYPIAVTALTGFTLVVDATNAFSEDAAQITGKAYSVDYLGDDLGVTSVAKLGAAHLDMLNAYNNAAGRPNSVAARINLGSGILSGAFGGQFTPLTTGVYTFGTGVQITGDIHFYGSAADIFIIQIAKGLTIDANKKVILTGGVLAKNIFWQVGEAVSVGVGAHMEGIILGKTAIIFKTGSSLNGRILAQTACTLDTTTVTQPTV